MKIYLYIFILFILGCKSDVELAMERGIQYYEWEKIEEAILEFKFIIHNLNSNHQSLNYKLIKLLSRAHHNLAVSYAKKKWYSEALIEAKKAFELIPTDENKKVIDLIKNKKNSVSKNKENIKSTNQ